MLEARLGHDPHVVLVPETAPDERVVLTGTLVDIFGQLVDPPTRGSRPRRGPSGATSPCRSWGWTR